MGNGTSSGDGIIGYKTVRVWYLCLKIRLMHAVKKSKVLYKDFTRLEYTASKLVHLASSEKSVSDISAEVKSVD